MKYLNRTSQDREKHHYFNQQQGDNRKQHNPNHRHHSISLNDVFRSLLALTQLDKDIPTLIKLLKNKGLKYAKRVYALGQHPCISTIDQYHTLFLLVL